MLNRSEQLVTVGAVFHSFVLIVLIAFVGGVYRNPFFDKFAQAGQVIRMDMCFGSGGDGKPLFLG